MKKLGTHIRMLREAKGLTQVVLSNRMDKDFQSLQRVEQGDINPSIYYLFEVAQALEIDLSELVNFK